MASHPPGGARDAKMDATSLYREEVYTDRAAATLRVLVPVTKDGAPDTSRPTVYTGAAAKYGDAAKAGVDHAMRELQEMRRAQQSSLVIPQGGVPNLGGGGKIQLP